MSKMDGLRAMREARYAENAARAKSPAPASKKPAAAAKPAATEAATTKSRAAEPPDSVEATEPALCGHRNMGGRSCTREQGHAAKSHRYS